MKAAAAKDAQLWAASAPAKEAAAKAAATIAAEALPYLEPEIDINHELQEKVNAMIREEMERMAPRDYLQGRHAAKSRLRSPLLLAEMARLAAGKPMAPMDVARYEVPPPAAGLKNDLQEWRKSVANARAQLEHQSNRLLNLELLQNLGAQGRLAHNAALEAAADALEARAQRAHAAGESVNVARRTAQEAAAPTLFNLTATRQAAARKNLQIAVAIGRMLAEVKVLEQHCKKRGLLDAATVAFYSDRDEAALELETGEDGGDDGGDSGEKDAGKKRKRKGKSGGAKVVEGEESGSEESDDEEEGEEADGGKKKKDDGMEVEGANT